MATMKSLEFYFGTLKDLHKRLTEALPPTRPDDIGDYVLETFFVSGIQGVAYCSQLENYVMRSIACLEIVQEMISTYPDEIEVPIRDVDLETAIVIFNTGMNEIVPQENCQRVVYLMTNIGREEIPIN